MIDSSLYSLGLLFALGTGLGAGVLAVLSWSAFRGSPVGSSLALLAAVMSLATFYHAWQLVIDSGSRGLDLLGGGMYLAALGVCYLIVRTHRRIAVPIRWYRPFAIVAVVGGVGFALGGVVAKLAAPAVVHWLHGATALLLCVGLFGTLQAHLGNERWIERVLRTPERSRSHDWMRPLDHAILELLSAADLILTPAVIATNLGYSREEVNRRIRELESRGLVERVERGKYSISTAGETYLDEPLTGPDEARDR